MYFVMRCCQLVPLKAHQRVSAGPVELVMVRAPEGARGEHARNRALKHGLKQGMKAGCEAALLVEVKASVASAHMWQV